MTHAMEHTAINGRAHTAHEQYQRVCVNGASGWAWPQGQPGSATGSTLSIQIPPCIRNGRIRSVRDLSAADITSGWVCPDWRGLHNWKRGEICLAFRFPLFLFPFSKTRVFGCEFVLVGEGSICQHLSNQNYKLLYMYQFRSDSFF